MRSATAGRIETASSPRTATATSAVSASSPRETGFASWRRERPASTAVVETHVAEPTHREVMGRTLEETLTLVTCYPFSYIGTAPRRYVVVAVPI